MLESWMDEQSPLEDHLTALWPRLAVMADGLQRFTSREDSEGWLQIARYGEEFDESTRGLPPGSDLERFGGQHPFLGWGLDALQIQFLASVGLGINGDEYG